MQGLGGGMILSVTNIIIGDLVPLQERGVVSGILGLLVHHYSFQLTCANSAADRGRYPQPSGPLSVVL